MSGQIGTLDLVANEIAHAFAPLAQRLALGEVRDLFAELGVQFPPELANFTAFTNALMAGANAASALVPPLVELASAVQSEDVGRIAQAGLTLVQRINAVATAVRTIAQQLEALASSLPRMTQQQVVDFA